MTWVREMDPRLQTLALMAAAGNVREGRWFEGAPSHVMAELQTQLAAEGYQIVKVPAPLPERRTYSEQPTELDLQTERRGPSLGLVVTILASVLAATVLGLIAGELIAR